jgi:hypothetical protein
MSVTPGRKPQPVDDDDYDVESSRIEKISIEELRQLLEDSPTDEVEVIPDDTE